MEKCLPTGRSVSQLNMAIGTCDPVPRDYLPIYHYFTRTQRLHHASVRHRSCAPLAISLLGSNLGAPSTSSPSPAAISLPRNGAITQLPPYMLSPGPPLPPFSLQGAASHPHLPSSRPRRFRFPRVPTPPANSPHVCRSSVLSLP